MRDPYKILLIEDERGMILVIKDRLVNEGYLVDVAQEGDFGLMLAEKTDYDLIILDIMLPGKNGFVVCRDLREKEIFTPVLMLTARAEIADKVLGFRVGADDYLTKPFDVIELTARIEALIRRDKKYRLDKGPKEFEYQHLLVNFRSNQVFVDGNPVVLSGKEFELLQFMTHNKGSVFSRDQLLDEVWGYDSFPVTRTVDVHISCLRQKIEKDPKNPTLIVTVHGRGYLFNA